MSAMKSAAKSMVDDLFGKQSVSDTLYFGRAACRGRQCWRGTTETRLGWTNAKSAVASEDFQGSANPFDLLPEVKTVRSSGLAGLRTSERAGAEYGADRCRSDDGVSGLTVRARTSRRTSPILTTTITTTVIPVRPTATSRMDCVRKEEDDGTVGRRYARNIPANTNPKRTLRLLAEDRTRTVRLADHRALSNSKSTVTNAIDALRAQRIDGDPGGTALGLALSPEAPFTEGKGLRDERSGSRRLCCLDRWPKRYRRSAVQPTTGRFSVPLGCGVGPSRQHERLLCRKRAEQQDRDRVQQHQGQGDFDLYDRFPHQRPTTQNLLKNCASKPDMY